MKNLYCTISIALQYQRKHPNAYTAQQDRLCNISTDPFYPSEYYSNIQLCREINCGCCGFYITHA